MQNPVTQTLSKSNHTYNHAYTIHISKIREETKETLT